jgi:hypothetical protein
MDFLKEQKASKRVNSKYYTATAVQNVSDEQ